MNKKILSLVFSLFCGTLIIGCGSKENKTNATKIDTNIPSVSTAKPVISSLNITQTALGSINAIETPTIAAEVAGKINKIYVTSGQTVKKEQALADIDKKFLQLTYETDQATLTGLAAQLKNQADTVARYQKLMTDNYTSKSMLENETTNYDSLKAQYQAAQKKVEIDKHNLAKTTIYSPIDGIIQTRNISIGDFVAVGTPAFTLVNTQNLQARITFPETIRPLLKIGQTVQLRSVSTSKIINTKISAIVPALNSQTRGIDIIADFTNTGDFMPGASTTATILIKKKTNALMIPNICLVQRPKHDIVFTIKDNKAVANPVTTGIEQNDNIEIRQGLKANSTIICDGAGFLEDGSAIRIAKGH